MLSFLKTVGSVNYESRGIIYVYYSVVFYSKCMSLTGIVEINTAGTTLVNMC